MVMTFSRDAKALTEAVAPYRHEMINFEPNEWLKNPDNLAITDGEGNFALFEKTLGDGVYTGHYVFQSRGKEAKEIALQMLDYLFENTDIRVVRGLTPLTKLAARWMSRQIGFKSQGVIHTDFGPCELFVIVKDSK